MTTQEPLALEPGASSPPDERSPAHEVNAPDEGEERPLEGTVEDGTVERIDGDDVHIVFGRGLHGTAPLCDFRSASGETAVKVGERVAVYVEQLAPSAERYVLSKDKADRWHQLQAIVRAHANEEVIEGEIVAAIDGGFAVDVGVRAFLPASLFGLRPVRDHDQVLGQRFRFKVIRLDERRHNIVLSRRALLDEEHDKSLERLKPGAVVEGVVKNIVDYGAFVEVAGIDGLLHLSDMSFRKVNHPSEVVKIGERLTLKVLKFDPSTQRLSLGLRQAQEDPWAGVGRKYHAGSRVKGLVVSKTDYGCFVEIEPGIEGLVHASGPMITPGTRELLKRIDIGEDLEAVVLDVDATKKRISLKLPDSGAGH